MAIVIPQKNIFNYDFNILVDNYIEKVEIAQDSVIGYEPIKYTFAYSNNAWTSNDINILGQTTKNVSTNSGSITYTRVAFQFSMNYTVYGSNPFSTIRDMEMNLSNASTTISERIDYINSLGLDSYQAIKDFGNGIFYFKEEIDYFNGNGILYIKTKEVVDGTTINYTNCEFTINVSEGKAYEDSEEQINTTDIYTLPYVDLFHVSNYIYNESLGYPRIKKVIQENIINNYNKGKMTLNIETRYTNFKDDEGNDINNGKPYLIRVGDIVKPEMTNKFSNFEYEYIVTSVEYEYNGSDKVYLKLLQR